LVQASGLALTGVEYGIEMSRAIPWSIKGVDTDAREAARDAALREGMTLGQWLKHAIETHAAERGLDAFCLDDDERAAAIKARLARIADHAPARPSNVAPSWTNASPPSTPQSPNRVNEMLRNLSIRLGENASPAARPAIEMTIQDDDASRLLATRRTTSASIQPRETAAPLQIDRKVELQEALRAARALYAARPAREPMRQEMHKEAPNHIEVRQDDASQDAYPFAPPARPARGGTAEQAQEAPRSRVNRPAEITPPSPDASLRQDLDRLSSSVASLQPRRSPPRTVEPLRREMPQDSSLRDVSRMSAAAPETRLEPADPVAQSPLINIERHLQSLTSKVETLREATTNSNTLEALQSRAKGIQERIEDIAARPDNAAKIERQLDLLGSRIDALAASTPSLADANELARGLTEIRAILSKAPNQGLLEGLDRKVEQLARKLENALTAADPAPQFDDLARRIDNVHRKLDTNASLLAKVDTSALEKMMQELASKFAQPAPKFDIPAPNLAPVESEIRRLANKMDAVASRPENPVLEGLRRDIASLSARVDMVSANAQSAAAMASQASAETLEALRKEMAGFSARLDAMTASAPEVSVLDGLQTQIALLVDRIETLTRRDPPGVHALENRIVQLADKMDSMSSPSREGLMMVQLQAEIGRLARQIDSAPDDVGAPVHALLEQVRSYLARIPQQGALTGAPAREAAVANSMSDLFQQIQDLRSATADAADLAARTSAREALESKAQEVAQNPDADEAVKRELQDLRAQQERADRRTTQVLSAVHETMERLVGRLSSLESEICEVRPEPVAPVKAGEGAAHREPAARTQQPPRQDRQDTAPPEIRPEPRQGARQDPKRESQQQAHKEPAPEGIAPTPQVAKPVEPQPRQPRTQSAGAALLNRASFIAAARRASHASEDPTKATAVSRLENLFSQMSGRGAEPSPEPGPQPQARSQGQPKAPEGPLGALRKAISARRKPMLIALAGLIVVLASLQALRSRSGAEQPVAAAESVGPSITSAAPLAPPVETAATAAPEAAPTPVPSSPIIAAPDAPAAQGFTAPLQANGFDTTPIGSTPAQTQQLADAAAKGNPAAQFEMGVRLAEGRGVNTDHSAALQWFEKSAQQNLAPAQFRLAAMLERGLGADKNLKRAADLYAKAAAQGHVRAMHNLGVLHAEGLDGKPDYLTAATWFRKAAEYGVGDSQYNLAILYARGMGVEKNLPTAWAWFTAAAALGDKDAALKRDEITQRLNGAQMTAAKALGDAYRPRTSDPAINQVTTPPGGWETLSVATPPKPAAASTPSKAKVSKL